MASSSKKKTTMAKRNRERAVLERRVRKQARKDARKQAAADVADGAVVAADEPTAAPHDDGPAVARHAGVAVPLDH